MSLIYGKKGANVGNILFKTHVIRNSNFITKTIYILNLVQDNNYKII